MAPITSINDPRYLKAMTHPARARIIAMLSERQASPVELSRWLGITLGATAYHVRLLHELGLLELVDERRVRGAIEHYYRARPLPRRPKQADAISRQVDVAAALHMIQARLTPAASAGAFDNEHAVLEHIELLLDDRGLAELAAECQRLLDRAGRLAEQADKRLRQSGDTARNAALAVFALDVPALADQIAPSPRKVRARPAPLLGRSSQPQVRELILEHLHQRPATVGELADALDLPAASVRNALKTLQAAGQLAETGERRRQPGQRGPGAMLYSPTS